MNTSSHHIKSYVVIYGRNVEKPIFPKLSWSCFSFYIYMALFLFVVSGCKQNVAEKKVVKTYEKTLPHPAWVSQDPVVIVGNWDAMAIFRRRVGANPVWQEDDYNKQHSEEAVKTLKDMGVTMAIIHFYKGFGLVAEKEYIEDSKKLASLCKKYGIKVGVYIGSTVAYETFLQERPDAEKWFVPDYLGSPVRYGGTQTFRKFAYFMHPDFIEYMKGVLRIAIEDLKVDLIHFDNSSMRAQPAIFFHPLAIENFRTYLRNKYTPEMLKKRLGFSDVRYVEPPKYNSRLSTIDDPLFQEWTDFRCQESADYYGEMAEFIKGLNPNVAVEINPGGLSGKNSMWYDGSTDYPRILSHTDFFWTESDESILTDDKILISTIRTYKMARTLDNRLFNYTSSSKLAMAQAMAYNRQGLGMVGGILEAPSLPEDQKNYIKFFHKNFDYYRDIVNIADVAVLHSYATMAYNNDRPYQSTYLFEQALIQEKIPFDIIFDNNLKDLSKYKVLVLADQECLSDEKLDLIRKFVNQGGGLIATEHSSLYTEWRQRKRDFGLNDLFQVKAPGWHEDNSSPEDILNIPVQKRQIGKGRVVYIPEVQPSIPKPPTVFMISRYWRLPVNWRELIESVQWVSANSLSVNIEAPLTVTMEIVQKVDKSALILHLVNFDSKDPSVKNIKVDVQVPEGKKVTKVTVITPDDRDDDILQFKESGKRTVFIVPQLSTYNMVVMKLE
jgi:hypothetical protein